MDLGRETKVVIDGKTYSIGRLTVGVIEEFAAWVREQAGDPFELLDKYIDKLPKEDALRMMQEAKAEVDALKNFSLSSPVAKKWLSTERGIVRLIHLLLMANHPDTDADLAWRVLLKVGEEGIAKALKNATGNVPNAPGPAAA